MMIPTVHFLNANDAATCGNPNAQYGTTDRKTFNNAISPCGRCRAILEKQKRKTPKRKRVESLVYSNAVNAVGKGAAG
jgi:cytidine deaminase